MHEKQKNGYIFDQISFSPLLEDRESVMETVCDVYIIWQESHYVGLLGLVVQSPIELVLD